jgi:Rrf2 family transcriptional regulator, cysteine metabolism repressor
VKLSTRTRYGTRALLELALHGGKEPLSLKDIAAKQQISLSYLEQLIAPLIASGIIRSTKGPKGGISLARNPGDIKLIEITRLLEGSVSPAECIDNPEACKRSEFCATRDIWSGLKNVMDDFLENTTLQDLVDRQRSKGRNDLSMYYI